MAIETTPLGFKKPDGNESIRNGNDIISDNAQKAQELLTNALNRIGTAEANINAGSGNGPGLVEDPLNPGTYFIASGSPIIEDPSDPGFYLIGTN